MKKNEAFRTKPCDLRRVFEDSLMARHICSPLESCDVGDNAESTRAYMREKHFDMMGLSEKGVATRYVRQDSLGPGKCGQYGNELQKSDIVAGHTHLTTLLRNMVEHTYQFVSENSDIVGIITRADLQKTPVRMLLFGLVSLMEMYMTSMVDVHYPHGSFEQCIDAKRIDKAKQRLKEAEDDNVDIGLVDCLEFYDKTTLLFRIEGFWEFFSSPNADTGAFATEDGAQAFFRDAKKLRDRLAHSYSLAGREKWPHVMMLALKIESFLRQCEAKEKKFTKWFRRG